MPTLITELTQPQSMWLYEHQLTRGDSYEEKWHYQQQQQRYGYDPASFDTTIFRSKAHKRKLPYEEDAEIVVKMRRNIHHDEPSSNEHSPLLRPHQQQQQHFQHSSQRNNNNSIKVNHGPRFPHTGEKLTWAQSRENLKVYYDHYGNCNVPQKYKDNRKLGRWVNKQRKKKKNPSKYGALTHEQIADLENLGFVWNH